MQATACGLPRSFSISRARRAVIVRVFPLPGHAVSRMLFSHATALRCSAVRLIGHAAIQLHLRYNLEARLLGRRAEPQLARTDLCRTVSLYVGPRPSTPRRLLKTLRQIFFEQYGAHRALALQLQAWRDCRRS